MLNMFLTILQVFRYVFFSFPVKTNERKKIIFSAFCLFQNIPAPFTRRLITLRIALSIDPLPVGSPLAVCSFKSLISLSVLDQIPGPLSAQKIICDASLRLIWMRCCFSRLKKSSMLPHEPSRMGLMVLIFFRFRQIG